MTAAGVSFAALVACSASPPPVKHPFVKPNLLHNAEVGLGGPPGVPAYAVATLENDAAPAAMARRGTDGVVVFDKGQHLFAQRFDTKKGITEKAVDLGAHGPLAPNGVGVEARADGYVVLYDEAVDQNHNFKLLGLDRKGAAVGAPLALPPIAEKVALSGLIVGSDGVLVLHEIQKNGTSDLYVTPVDAGLKRAGSAPQQVAHAALGWNATRNEHGASFAVVTGPASGDGEPLGRVTTFSIDASGKKTLETSIVDKPVAHADVEVAEADGSTFVAWTDRDGPEAMVRFAVARGGKVIVAPKRVSTPMGEQGLMALVADRSEKRALLAWESVGEGDGEGRQIEVATVGTDGSVSKERTAFVLDAQGRADVVPDRGGFALVTVAPAEDAAPGAVKADHAPDWLSYVRLGSDLGVRASEPIRFAGTGSRDGTPDLAHSLSCEGGDCTLLAISGAGPARLFVAVLPERSSSWKPAAWRADGSAKPVVRETRNLFEGESLSEVTAARLGGSSPRTLTAWLTYFVGGSPSKKKEKHESSGESGGEAPFAATLGIRVAKDDGTMGEPVMLSRRALSEGGVAIAEAPGKATSDAVVAWVAAEKGGSQVYVTRVDGDGKKTAQKKLTTITRSKGKGPETGASNVSIAYAPSPGAASGPRKDAADAPKGDSTDKPKGGKDSEKKKSSAHASSSEKKSGDGFVVAWVDTRDKNGEVYVARTNRELEKTVVDKRITNADGDASDVQVLVRGSDTFVVYSDARGTEQGDIYAAHLDTQTLAPIDSEGRVYASEAHSRSPKLALAGTHLIIAWIEEALPNADGTRGKATLRIAELDPVGKLISSPRILDTNLSVGSFELACSGPAMSSCRGVVSGETGGQVFLVGFTLGEDGAPGEVRKLTHLNTAALTETSPKFADASGAAMVLLEESAGGRARLLGLDW